MDAEGGAALARDGGVGHHGGVVDEAFDAAEGFGEGEQFGALAVALRAQGGFCRPVLSVRLH